MTWTTWEVVGSELRQMQIGCLVRICISRHHRSRVAADADALLQVPTQFRLDSASVRHFQPQNIPSLLIQLSLKLPHHEWCEEVTAGDIVPLDAFIATRMR